MRLAILLLFLSGVLVANAQPARIIFIRHAEKPDDPQDPHLSKPGRDRAERIVKWLGEGKVLGTNGTPVALYAAAPTVAGHNLRVSRRWNQRPAIWGYPSACPVTGTISRDWRRICWATHHCGEKTSSSAGYMTFFLPSPPRSA